MNASAKEGVNDKGNSEGLNEVLYGFKAYKSYFILGDYMVALGAGVTNKRPELDGEIRTTIDQTAWTDEVFSMKGENGACRFRHSLAFVGRWYSPLAGAER